MRLLALSLVLALTGCAGLPAADATPSQAPQLVAAFDDEGALQRRYPQAEQVGRYGTVTVWRLELTPEQWRHLQASGRYSPVYGEAQGQLRALPGGVVVRLKPELSEAEGAAWLRARSLAATPMNGPRNTYLVETPAGAAALELAERLSGMPEVAEATPNWWKARSARR